MPLYKYEAKDLNGKLLKGKIELNNVDELRKILKQKGFYLTKYDTGRQSLNIDFDMLKKIPKKDISIFCREMYFALSSGITIIQSLEIVKDQIENKKLKSILRNVYDEVGKGKLLSEVFKKHKDLPNLFVYMIEVGEETGKIDEIMKSLADYYDNQYKQEKKIKNALIYPKFLFIFSILIVLVLVTFVVPIFVKNLLSANISLPIPTQIVVWISNFMKRNWIYIILIVLLFLIIKNNILNKNKAYKMFRDRFIVKFKFIKNMTMQIYTARFARTFSILFGGGISVVRCIEICSDVIGNEYLKKKLINSKDLINEGSSIAESLEISNAFPKMLIQSIKVGEESGSVEEILEKASQFYDSESNFALEKLTNLVEPVMIVVLAILVGFIVISLLLPMFSMYDTVQIN